MGVERIVPAKLDLTVLDKIERAARFAIAHRFELEQNDIGETVINLEKIHVAARYSGHFESLGGGIGQADSEREIGRAHVELQSLMRISYAVFCLTKKTTNNNITRQIRIN